MQILFFTLCAIGVLVAIIGSIQFLIVAFRESVLWGLGCMFLGPVSLVFLILKWQDAKKSFLTQLAGWAIVGVALLLAPTAFRSRSAMAAVLPTGAPHITEANKPAPKPGADAAILAELGRREENLRVRKAALNPQDRAAAVQLRDEILRYNEDLKTATGQELHGVPPATPPSKIASAITGQLVALRGGAVQPFDNASLASVRLYAVYFSAEWCPPCRAFTPELVAWYKQHKAANPNFELIFVSRDRSAGDMTRYMTTDAMPWPAVAWEKIKGTPLSRYAGSGIPCLVLLDSDGKVLSDSYVNGNYRGPRAVLSEMTQRLSATPARLAQSP